MAREWPESLSVLARPSDRPDVRLSLTRKATGMAATNVTRDDLAAATGAALGRDRKIKEVTRLAGGTTKGVYRLTMDDGATAIAYLWEDSENYWPRAPNENDVADPFSPSNSIEL